MLVRSFAERSSVMLVRSRETDVRWDSPPLTYQSCTALAVSDDPPEPAFASTPALDAEESADESPLLMFVVTRMMPNTAANDRVHTATGIRRDFLFSYSGAHGSPSSSRLFRTTPPRLGSTRRPGASQYAIQLDTVVAML